MSSYNQFIGTNRVFIVSRCLRQVRHCERGEKRELVRGCFGAETAPRLQGEAILSAPPYGKRK